jgi:hypothetical protein
MEKNTPRVVSLIPIVVSLASCAVSNGRRVVSLRHRMPSFLSRLRPSLDRYGHVHLLAPLEVPRFAADLPAEERLRFREEFRGTATRLRLIRGIATVLIAAFGLASFFGRPALTEGRLWSIALAVVCIVIAVANVLPQCPSCHNRLARLGRFCPNCGASDLGSKGGAPYCSSCDTSITGFKGKRRYKRRACSSCGLMLDEEGL